MVFQTFENIFLWYVQQYLSHIERTAFRCTLLLTRACSYGGYDGTWTRKLHQGYTFLPFDVMIIA